VYFSHSPSFYTTALWEITMDKKTETVWILYWKSINDTEVRIVRIYNDKARAEKDFDLVTEDTDKNWCIKEMEITE